MSPDNETTTTLRIVDMTGHVVALTQFTPPPAPAIGSGCVPLVQPPVRVTREAAYFVDSSGVVRKLTAAGDVSQVATLKGVHSQQDVTFAVSPDGTQLISIIVSTPPLHDPPPKTLGDPIFGPGTWTLDLETAAAGGSTSVVLHRDFGTAYPNPTLITGWDNFGPTATLNSALCTQNAIPSLRYNGTLVHLGMDGTHLDRVGGASCTAWDELVDGTTLCGGVDWQHFTVRTRDGTDIWSRETSCCAYDMKLAPDGNAVASGDGVIYGRSSTQAASFARTSGLAASLLGWAEPGYAVAILKDGRLGVVPAQDPLVFRDLGLALAYSCTRCGLYGVTLIGTIA